MLSNTICILKQTKIRQRIYCIFCRNIYKSFVGKLCHIADCHAEDKRGIYAFYNCYSRSFIELTFSKRRLSTFALVEKLYTNLHHRFLYCLSV